MRERELKLRPHLFGYDWVMFTITSYLPGEYVLRIIPLLCKATRSLRLSISLLGSTSTSTSTLPKQGPKHYYPMEGPIYGVYSIWRDLERVLKPGHHVNSLRIEEEIIFLQPQPLSTVKMLSLPDFFKGFSFLQFPNLTALEFGPKYQKHNTQAEEELMREIWTIPLISLSVMCTIAHETAQEYIQGVWGPPAFSHTLRSLKTHPASLLDIFSPYCRHLRCLETPEVHEIIDNNTGLTSLTLTTNSSPSLSTPSFSLTAHTQLIRLSVTGGHHLSTTATHSQLEYVSLSNPYPESAARFLIRCPALKYVSFRSCGWLDVVRISLAIPQPAQCQLNIDISNGIFPTVDGVEMALLRRGFRINEEFLFKTKESLDHHKGIMELVPHITREWKVLEGGQEMYTLLCDPSILFLQSFQALSVIDLRSIASWHHGMLRYLGKHCSHLKELRLNGGNFYDNFFELQSQELCKLEFSFSQEILQFNLQLPNLSHLSLSLQRGDLDFLSLLLSGEIDLPLLRVLALTGTAPRSASIAIQCPVGHRSLTRLKISGSSYTAVTIRLQKLPHLRDFTLEGVATTVDVLLDVPGDCDISLRRHKQTTAPYSRKGHYSDRTDNNFKARVRFEPPSRWVESDYEDPAGHLQPKKSKPNCTIS